MAPFVRCVVPSDGSVGVPPARRRFASKEIVMPRPRSSAAPLSLSLLVVLLPAVSREEPASRRLAVPEAAA